MPLTTAQYQTLKSNLAANTATVTCSDGVVRAINAIVGTLQTPDNAFAIAAWYNQTASPTYNGWNSAVDANVIFDQILWSHYTPAPAPVSTVQWSNCSLACQGKQFNIEIMLQGRTSFDATKPNLRGGLNDATTNLPAGSPIGTSISGGWSSILPLLYRTANNIEALFGVQTTGVGTNSGQALGSSSNPALLTYEGTLVYEDIQTAWAS